MAREDYDRCPDCRRPWGECDCDEPDDPGEPGSLFDAQGDGEDGDEDGDEG